MSIRSQRKQVSYAHLYVFCAFLVLAAFLVDCPVEVLDGFILILVSPSNLITDYIEIGGLGAAFFNSGLIGLSSVENSIYHGRNVLKHLNVAFLRETWRKKA